MDIGDDPCFDDPPTWGICRPPTRRSVQVGTNLFFVAYVAPNQYLVKGWFQVGEKISYIEAQNRFPNRANVIIRRLPNNQPLERVIQNRQLNWRYPERQQAYIGSKLLKVPDFLYRTISNNDVYFQNPADEHEIDNWKCSRIFLCRTNQFLECIVQSRCHKEGEILQPRYHNYVVAHQSNWIDIGTHRLTWADVESHFHFNLALRTPKGQHNVLLLPEERVQDLINYLSNAKNGG